MDSFWKWLMRANARGVFIVSVIVLVLVLAWWVWREFAPLERGISMVPGAGGTDKSRDSLGLLAFLEEERGRDSVQPPPYFFLNLPAPYVAPSTNAVATNLEPVVAVAPVKPADPKAAPPAPKKKEVTTLVYKGKVQRTDDQVLALIGDSKSGGSKFYRSGDEVCGMVLGEFSKEEARVAVGGEEVVLEFGKPANFEEGKHVE